MSMHARLRLLSDGWREDGHPHERTQHGFCTSCGARASEAHYRLKPKAPAEPVSRSTRIEWAGNIQVHHRARDTPDTPSDQPPEDA